MCQAYGYRLVFNHRIFIFPDHVVRHRRDAVPGGDGERHQGPVLVDLAVAQTRETLLLSPIMPLLPIHQSLGHLLVHHLKFLPDLVFELFFIDGVSSH